MFIRQSIIFVFLFSRHCSIRLRHGDGAGGNQAENIRVCGESDGLHCPQPLGHHWGEHCGQAAGGGRRPHQPLQDAGQQCLPPRPTEEGGPGLQYGHTAATHRCSHTYCFIIIVVVAAFLLKWPKAEKMRLLLLIHSKEKKEFIFPPTLEK